MSLLLDAMEKCIFMDKTTQPDGYGSVIPVWTEGAEFNAAIVFNTSIEARRAAKEGVTSLYTITTPRNLTLSYNDVFKRKSDNKLFRVTSDGDDSYTPSSAILDMRQVTAEELSSLPSK
jgi:hypothetical protein